MDILAVGLSHRTAPVEVRERVSFSENAIEPALGLLTGISGVEEAAIISTCNRTEVYALCSVNSSPNILIEFLSANRHVPQEDFASHLYSLRGLSAARHLMGVASGLDSLVLGEPQILRQVRTSFQASAHASSLGPVLDRLFRAAIVAGKRARTETLIGSGGFSVGHAAVDLAKSVFGSLSGAGILVLGAGKMSELTAKHMVADGAKFVIVANRTHDRAIAVAERLGGHAIRYDEFDKALERADIVISSTASPTPVVHREMIASVMKKRRGRPLIVIDIAVPRDVEPEVGQLDDVFLYDVDDLENVVADMAKDRAGEVPRVEEIIEEEVQRFDEWRRTRESAPILAAIKHKHEEARLAEIARLRNQLPHLSDLDWTRIEAAMKSLANRMAKCPVDRLRMAQIAGEPGARELAEAARELFALDEAEAPKPAAEVAE